MIYWPPYSLITEQVVLSVSTWKDAHVDGSISPPRSGSPEASNFLPSFECLCRCLTFIQNTLRADGLSWKSFPWHFPHNDNVEGLVDLRVVLIVSDPKYTFWWGNYVYLTHRSRMLLPEINYFMLLGISHTSFKLISTIHWDYLYCVLQVITTFWKWLWF